MITAKKMLKALFDYVFSKKYRFLVNTGLHFYDKVPDEEFLKRNFKLVMGKELDLENPKTFNEKLQWLKLYDRKPEYTMMADKYAVRKYIAEKLGEEYLIPLLGVWDNPDDIDFDKLPNKFVLKCTHNSGLGMCICKDKSKLDIKKTKKNLKRGLNQNYYLLGREWPYKNIPRKIIAEAYMEDIETEELRDYKFFCFNGYVENVMVCIERNIAEPKFYFFNKEWDLLRINKRGKSAPKGFTILKPKGLEAMFKVASELSKGLAFARIDLYYCNGRIYFGEITFFPDSGLDQNLLPETDKYLGKLINIEKFN